MRDRAEPLADLSRRGWTQNQELPWDGAAGEGLGSGGLRRASEERGGQSLAGGPGGPEEERPRPPVMLPGKELNPPEPLSGCDFTREMGWQLRAQDLALARVWWEISSFISFKVTSRRVPQTSPRNQLCRAGHSSQKQPSKGTWNVPET